jgi:hypothetical protein
MNVPEHLQTLLDAESAVIAASVLIRTSGGRDGIDAYDAAVEVERVAYDAMNAKGLTRAQWAHYDRTRRAMYRKLAR